jgi:hypothetical protein
MQKLLGSKAQSHMQQSLYKKNMLPCSEVSDYYGFMGLNLPVGISFGDFGNDCGNV